MEQFYSDEPGPEQNTRLRIHNLFLISAWTLLPFTGLLIAFFFIGCKRKF